MTNPLKPINLTISDLKEIVGDNPRLAQADEEEPETFLTEEELADLQVRAKKDYSYLCGALGLCPIPLDVFCPSVHSEAATQLGTPVKNFTPGYNPKNIVIPMVPGTNNKDSERDLSFPPSTWELMSPEWPKWRLDLWHETLHQIEHDVLNSWDGSNEKHGDSYTRALEYAVSKLSVLKSISNQELRLLTLGL